MAATPPGQPINPTTLEYGSEVIERERRMLWTSVDAIDTKAGGVLAFAAAVIAIARDVDSLTAKIGIGVGIAAAFLAMWALFPRRHPYLSPDGLRNYLGADITLARRQVWVAEAAMVSDLAEILRRKTRRLGVALAALVIAVALIATGTLVSDGGASHRSPHHRSGSGAHHRP